VADAAIDHHDAACYAIVMFSWIEIALALLKFANLILGEVHDEKQFKAGADAEIARMAQIILAKTAAGKKIMERVNALSSADVDNGLVGLEPK